MMGLHGLSHSSAADTPPVPASPEPYFYVPGDDGAHPLSTDFTVSSPEDVFEVHYMFAPARSYFLRAGTDVAREARRRALLRELLIQVEIRSAVALLLFPAPLSEDASPGSDDPWRGFDGERSGTITVTGLSPGIYTARLYGRGATMFDGRRLLTVRRTR